ncbi:MAPEG family protein [Novosphingobium lentum]|uniref:MAPEG family protein n=1 Tax=Novosphingobium lentum TaxID=145287 RepID=UPI00082F19E9|nr:MAPEG family protein [Novosphingobium lentum]
MILSITLAAAAAAAIINIWLSMRIGALRTKFKISVGDGGNEALVRRMRAQLNFVENVPLVLVVIAAIELARGENIYLMVIAAIFIFGRVAHGLGMDGGALGAGRMIGTLTTMVSQLALAIWAVWIILH